jgi:large subunit ribosomal protein L10
MSKPVKQMLTDYLRNRYDQIDSACVVSLAGLDVISTEKLRKALREKKARLEVVKNSLARRAFESTPLKPLGASLTGPCALIVSEESLVDVAKKLLEFAREFKQLELKNAIYAGDPNLLTIAELAKMRSRRELLGDVAALISGPGRRVAGAIGGAQGRVAGCIKAIADKPEEPAAA